MQDDVLMSRRMGKHRSGEVWGKLGKMKSQTEKSRGYTAGEVPESPGSVCLELGREIWVIRPLDGGWSLHNGRRYTGKAKRGRRARAWEREAGRAEGIANAWYLCSVCRKLADFQPAGDMAPVSLWPS